MNRISLVVWIFLAAVFLLFAYPPFSQSWLALIGLVPVFLLARRANPLLVGFLFGLFFHGLGLLWVTGLSVIGWLILTLYLSLYPALFFCVTRHFSPRGYALKAAALGVILEFIAGTLATGFPWFALALTQHRNQFLLHLAPLGGAWLVSFLLYLVNATVFGIFFLRLKNAALSPLLAIVILLHLATYPPLPGPAESSAALDFVVVQGNVPSSLRRQGPVLEPYIEKTRGVRAGTDLIIWPETTFFSEDAQAPPRVADLLAEKQSHLLAGVLESDGGRMYNSAVLFAPDGTRRAVYRKNHLVPFGEYIPGRRFRAVRRLVERDAGFLPSLEPGAGPVVMEVNRVPLAPLICYESIFPFQAIQSAGQAPGYRPVFVVLTNDSWLGLLGAGQHFGAAALRAAENGAPLVRAANTGISAFFDYRGRELGQLPLRRRALMYGTVPALEAGPTPFQRFPLAVPAGALLLLGGFALSGRVFS